MPSVSKRHQLSSLGTVLNMEPLTENRQVNGPVVYGFLRLVRVPAARQEALTASLVEYCRSHELRLCGVFADRDGTSGASCAAFTGLLDVLSLPDVYGVVVPTASHLGPKAVVAQRGRRIEAAGSKLILVRRPSPARQRAFRDDPTCRPSVVSNWLMDAES